jgi:hypothetical protein
MTTMASHWRRGFTLSLFIGGLLSTSGACGIREDEFDCENAVARLVTCCPGFEASSVDCTYSPGCGNAYPSLDPTQSTCILQSSCSSLQSTGVCNAAASLSTGSETEATFPSVCPLAQTTEDAGLVVDAGPPVSIMCTGPNGCEAGQVCCAVPNGSLAVVTLCQGAPCPGGGIELCSTPADCPAGLTCEVVVEFPGIAVCTTPPDASFDASTEACADVATEAAEASSSDAGADVTNAPDAPDDR